MGEAPQWLQHSQHRSQCSQYSQSVRQSTSHHHNFQPRLLEMEGGGNTPKSPPAAASGKHHCWWLGLFFAQILPVFSPPSSPFSPPFLPSFSPLPSFLSLSFPSFFLPFPPFSLPPSPLSPHSPFLSPPFFLLFRTKTQKRPPSFIFLCAYHNKCRRTLGRPQSHHGSFGDRSALFTNNTMNHNPKKPPQTEASTPPPSSSP